MKKLLIIGAGGHGRCCLDIARDLDIYDEICFLDNQNVGSLINDSLIIGTVDELYSFYEENVYVFVAIGNNEVRKKVMNQAKELGFSLPNLISPKAIFSKYASIGLGSVVFPNAVIEANANIGDGCIICANTTINHDALIKDFVLVYSNSVIRPNTLIKEMSRIGSGCVIKFGTILDENSDVEDLKVV